jgi:hypothetical protein
VEVEGVEIGVGAGAGGTAPDDPAGGGPSAITNREEW